MSGDVINGGTFGPNHTFGDGVVIVGGTFYAPVYFGAGATLVNPTFLKCCPDRYNNPWSEVGEGSTVEGGFWEYVKFGANNTLSAGGGPAYSLGGGTTINNSGNARGISGQWQAGGHIITEGDYMKLSDATHSCSCSLETWDEEVRSSGYLILNDDGTLTVTVPNLLIVCEE